MAASAKLHGVGSWQSAGCSRRGPLAARSPLPLKASASDSGVSSSDPADLPNTAAWPSHHQRLAAQSWAQADTSSFAASFCAAQQRLLQRRDHLIQQLGIWSGFLSFSFGLAAATGLLLAIGGGRGVHAGMPTSPLHHQPPATAVTVSVASAPSRPASGPLHAIRQGVRATGRLCWSTAKLSARVVKGGHAGARGGAVPAASTSAQGHEAAGGGATAVRACSEGQAASTSGCYGSEADVWRASASASFGYDGQYRHTFPSRQAGRDEYVTLLLIAAGFAVLAHQLGKLAASNVAAYSVASSRMLAGGWWGSFEREPSPLDSALLLLEDARPVVSQELLAATNLAAMYCLMVAGSTGRLSFKDFQRLQQQQQQEQSS